MMNETSRNSFAALRSLARPRAPEEHCELCGARLPSDHSHLLDPANRQIVCACEACAVSVGQGANARLRRIPRRVRHLPGFRMTEAQWDSLLIPVGMAFIFHSTPAGRVMAFYPGPAGATESLLSLETWQEIVRDNPILAEMEPDVEALLVNRVRGAEEYFLAPVDKCYELVGLIRTHWRGLGGGSQVWEAICRFFDRLKQQAETTGEAAHA